MTPEDVLTVDDEELISETQLVDDKDIVVFGPAGLDSADVMDVLAQQKVQIPQTQTHWIVCDLCQGQIGDHRIRTCIVHDRRYVVHEDCYQHHADR